MVPSLAVLNHYLYAKKEFLACSSDTIKKVCLPVWEAAFLMFESSVLVGGLVPFCFRTIVSNICHEGGTVGFLSSLHAETTILVISL